MEEEQAHNELETSSNSGKLWRKALASGQCGGPAGVRAGARVELGLGRVWSFLQMCCAAGLGIQVVGSVKLSGARGVGGEGG